MRRRTFIQKLPLTTGAAVLLPPFLTASPARKSYARFIASGIEAPPVSFPADKRVPLGFTAFPVPLSSGAASPVRLLFPKLLTSARAVTFRLTAAIDFRETKVIELYLPDSGRVMGTLEMRYAHPFQPFQTAIEARWLPDVHQQGLGLRMREGTTTAWFFRPEALPADAAGLAPQLLTGRGSASKKVFLKNLYSMNSFSPFGWMGGSVQDALYELHRQGKGSATQALQTHLNHYLDDRHGIVFENPHSRPLDGTFNSIEDFLPFAAIVNLYPDHPAVQKAVDYCLNHRHASGIIMAGNHVTTEGCYTVAYPLAAIAQVRQDSKLAQVALDQLRYRTQHLTGEAVIYQRGTLHGEKAYRNWGRGVAWYLLGTIKTLAILRESFGVLDGVVEAQQAWVEAVQLVKSHRNAQGLWYGYLDKPATEIDTSASAGIAAAMVWGVRLGVLPKKTLRAARATYRALHDYLTPDGFLTQVSQINRGGEDLQRSGYRVISQFGMGLMGQLKAALSA
jgi:hypothetical protein